MCRGKFIIRTACLLQFFAHKTTSDTAGVDHKSAGGTSGEDAGKSGANEAVTPGTQQTAPRRRSLDLYNEAAAILGLTCSQTNDCRCIECQVRVGERVMFSQPFREGNGTHCFLYEIDTDIIFISLSSARFQLLFTVRHS